ncbi:MAG: hypothetical protein HOA61_15900 [Bacteroidetes bacterium]|jgi:hypothetical protein|nr:hypothetical protein [Bacteroidota bacterium]
MKRITIISVAVMLSAMNLFAQTDEVKYRRSSLSMVLIESESFPNKDAVMKSWNSYPFPDKYNEHNIETKSFSIDAIKLTDKDLLEAGYLQDTLNNVLKITKAEALSPIRYLNNDKTLAVALPTEKQEYQIKIDKVIKEKGLAKQLVSTWFNRSSDGKFDMSLLYERGSYNASEMEAGIASGQVKGLASLKDAGEELIKKTFVTFTKLNFIENEPAAALVRDIAKKGIAESMAGKPQMLIDKALAQVDKVYEKTKEGYSLFSKTWLYSLAWNDSIMDVFKTEMWKNPSAFNETDIFKLEFVGVQYNQSLVTFKIGETRTQEQIVDLALVRNIDKAFAKLQKKNDVFKPAITVSSSGPIMAKIGLKEGISPGDKFEVLEMMWDEKEGKTTWKNVGSCAVDKKAPIWDNRYNAGEETEQQKDEEGNPVNATTFKGSKKIQVGMLLKQLK